MRISDWSSDVCSSDLTKGGLSVSLVSVEQSWSSRWTSACRPMIWKRWRVQAAEKRKYFCPEAFTGRLSQRTKRNRRRSEARRVGKECISTGRSRRSPYNEKKHKHKRTTTTNNT